MDKTLIKEMRQAIKVNDLNTVSTLVENNDGLLNVVTIFGTFLHDASMHGMYDIAKYLTDRGIDINKKGGSRDSSAMTIAAFNGYMDIVKLLYENGADLDVSSFERNPLFAAIYNGHFQVVRFLVENGIDLKANYAIGSLEKVDAYEYARQYGRTEIADFLREF